MSPTVLYISTLAQLASGHNNSEYHALPAYLRGLADAADSARDSYLALADACRQARATGSGASAAAVEALDVAGLLAWNAWQELERRGAELLAAHTTATRPHPATPALAHVPAVATSGKGA